jgi:hypothetical protein
MRSVIEAGLLLFVTPAFKILEPANPHDIDSRVQSKEITIYVIC